MKAITEREAIKIITTYYIDGAFVESHGREVINIIRPIDGQVIGSVTMADEEDTRRAIAAAKRGSRPTAGQQRTNERRFCAGCMRLFPHDAMI